MAVLRAVIVVIRRIQFLETPDTFAVVSMSANVLLAEEFNWLLA